VLQVRSASLLLVGDSNRTYTVELACMAPLTGEQEQAVLWLRQQLPRRSRVNLRPIGNRDGILLARVQKLGASADVSRGLIAAGFAEPLTEPMACR
jgi:cell division inhibitor SulA